MLCGGVSCSSVRGPKHVAGDSSVRGPKHVAGDSSVRGPKHVTMLQ